MTAPEALAEDVALDVSGAEVVSELAAEPLTPAVHEQPEPEPEALAGAEDEGMAPPSDAPAEDIAVGSAGFPIISELAAADAELAAKALDEAGLSSVIIDGIRHWPQAKRAAG